MGIEVYVDTAVTVPVNICALIDDGDFKTREESVAYNASGMDLSWNFVTPAGVVTNTAVTPTTSGDYDWSHAGNGMYKIEIPASGGASINNDTEGYGWFSGVASGVLPWTGPVITFKPQVLIDSLVIGSDKLQVDAQEWLGQTIAAVDTNGYPKVTIKDGTGQGEIATTSGKVDGVVLADAVTSVNGMSAAALKDFFDTDSTTDYSSAVAGSVVKEIADNAGGGSPPSASDIADEVETRTIAGVTTVGTVNALANNSVTAAALASDAVTEIQSGLATASALSTAQTAINDIPTNAELATALAGADDAVLSAIAALNNLSQSDVRSAVGMASPDLDTQLDAIVEAIEHYEFELVPAFTSTAGTTLRLIGLVKSSGQRVNVYSVDGTATCALAVREHGAGSDLFTITATTVDANGTFELSKSSPGFTADRLYRYTATVVISGDTYTFESAFPNFA